MEENICAAVLELARRHRPELTQVSPTQALVAELGLESLDIAQLVAMLEDQLGVDPFAKTGMSSVRTVEDLCDAYRRALA